MTRATIEFSFDQAVRTMGLTPERLVRLIDEGKIRVEPGFPTQISRQSVLDYMNQVGGAATEERAERAKPKGKKA